MAPTSERRALPGAAARADVPPARPRRRGWRTTLVTGAVLLPLVVGGAATFYATETDQALAAVPRAALLPTGARPPALATHGAVAPQAWLVLALRADDAGRLVLDGATLAHLPGDRLSVHLVTLPLDLVLRVDGTELPLSEVHRAAGAPGVVRALEARWGFRLDHVVTLDVRGVGTLTEALGGIWITNRQPGTWGGHSFGDSVIPLDAGAALAYVGPRPDARDDEVERPARLRAVLTAIVSTATSAAVLANPGRYSHLAALPATFLTLDDTLDDAAVRRTLTGLRLTSAADVVALDLPTTPADPGRVPAPEAAALVEALRTDSVAAYAADHPTRGAGTSPTPTPSGTK